MADEGDHHARRLTSITALISGGVAGAVAKTAIAPLDRVKILYQVSNSQKFTFRAAFRSASGIIKQEGVMGLWKGNTATLLRIMPYAAIQYSSFEQFQRIWMNMYQNSREHQLKVETEISGSGRFLSGAAAGATSVIFTYPLDLLRTRMAVDQHHPVRRLGHLKKIFTSILHSSGVLGLYRGLLPTLFGIVPYAGISFWTFETLKSLGQDQGRELLTTDRLLYGACAGLLSQSATYPLETIRRRMQVMPNSMLSVRVVLARIYRQEGLISGLYKGLSMNWIKGPIATGLSFTIYDEVRTLLEEQR